MQMFKQGVYSKLALVQCRMGMTTFSFVPLNPFSNFTTQVMQHWEVFSHPGEATFLNSCIRMFLQLDHGLQFVPFRRGCKCWKFSVDVQMKVCNLKKSQMINYESECNLLSKVQNMHGTLLVVKMVKLSYFVHDLGHFVWNQTTL